MRYVDQITAKKGDCIQTFDNKEICLIEGRRLEKLKMKHFRHRELVYTVVPGKRGAYDCTWQIYLLP